MSLADLEMGSVGIDKAPRGDGPIEVAGKTYEHGISMAAPARLLISLRGNGIRLTAEAGVCARRMPAGFTPPPGMARPREERPLEFLVLGDRRVLWKSGPLTAADQARELDVDIRGIEKLALVILADSGAGDFPRGGTAALGNARILFSGDAPPKMLSNRPVADDEPGILTPPESPAPRINGPSVIGARPGHPFLHTIPVTGMAPLDVDVKGLPEGLSLDSSNRILSGVTPPAGDYRLAVTARNSHGSASKTIILRSGSGIALTPPLGWNSWNVWGKSVDQEKVMAAADAMAARLRSHGWSYINIDDAWEAASRTTDGVLPGNQKFPDMKQLSDYVHAKGLKIGIYSSPGPTTCGGHLGSYEHEFQDASTWASWGFDYLKYDWCSYSRIVTDPGNREELQKPYRLMREALDAVDRDIVYSLCQYGMGSVWEWGADVGGNLWRTSGDIRDTWKSLLQTGFADNQNSWEYAGPGHWNDPDMLVVGKVGWGPQVHATGLTPGEQYAHLSLWSLLSAPLLIGCDMSDMDAFTLGLLTNDEVLEINQDALGRQARKVVSGPDYQVWSKELEDGSRAIGIFYTGGDLAAPDDPAAGIAWDNRPVPSKTITVTWDELGLEGKQRARDLWRQEDLGSFSESLAAGVTFHGVRLLRLSGEE